MGSIADDIATAKASFKPGLDTAKQEASVTIAEAKSALLADVYSYKNLPSNTGIAGLENDPYLLHNEVTSPTRRQFSDAVTDARKQFLLANPDPKRIIKTENNVQFLADGTFNIITADGKIIKNVRRDRIEELLAIENQRYADIQAKASSSPIIGLLHTGAKLAGDLAVGAAQKASDITGIGTSAQTTTEAVDNYNQDLSNLRARATISESMRLDKEPPPQPISKESLATYQNITKKNVVLISNDINSPFR